MGGSGSSVAQEATVFVGLDSQSGAESFVQKVSPITQTFTKFYCFGPEANAGTKNVFTVRINGVSQTGKCEVSGAPVVVATVSIKVEAGQLVDVEVTQGKKAAGADTWALAP